jgi:outer membrane PBP1 activator LpoA protein
MRGLYPILAVAAALVLVGCGPSTTSVRPAPVESVEKESTAKPGTREDQLRAAREYRRAAEKAASPDERHRLLLRAARAFLEGGAPMDARRILQQIEATATDRQILQEKRTLLQEVASAEQRAALDQDALLTARVEHPAKIALLLPVSGQFAQAAVAIRDGFLGAYYANRENTGITIQIYETTAENVVSVYQQAVSDGMQYAVGPLEKQAVQNLAELASLPVPVLALNHIDNSTPENFFQFSLSPEDEARQVAERIWLDGHSQGIALVPEGSWGDRIFAALNERLQQLGSSILEIQTYKQKEEDFSRSVSTLLNVDESKQRYRALRATLGGNVELEFENRRRQDIDFVFIVAFPREARQIRPVLRFYDAGKLPVYSTSHTYTGIENASADADMNDIIFADMPWVLDRKQGENEMHARVSRLWPQSAAKYMRLYAFGMDAFNIIPYMESLQLSSQARYHGRTGSIQLSPDKRLYRQLIWAKFTRGIPAIIE